MALVQQQQDHPINLEESSSTELHRVIVSEDESPSTLAPEMPAKPHAGTDCRELLRQPFDTEPGN